MDHPNDQIFQVSVKGLFFTAENKVLLLQQQDGNWEPPGGRVRIEEDFLECLQRECLEETGLPCRIPEKRPLIVYSSLDQNGRGRVMVYYKIELDGLEFHPSDECVDMRFFNKEEMRALPMVPQIRRLPDFL